MAVRIIVKPRGPKATPAAIATWKAAAQKVADENEAEAELIGRLDDGTVASHLIATPRRRKTKTG